MRCSDEAARDEAASAGAERGGAGDDHGVVWHAGRVGPAAGSGDHHRLVSGGLVGLGHRADRPGHAPGRAEVDQAVQCVGAGRVAGPASSRTSGHLHGRADRRGHRSLAAEAGQPGAAVRLLDAGPTGGVSQRGAGAADQAQPDQRAPGSRGVTLADRRDLVRRPGGSQLRRKKGAIVSLYTTPPPASVTLCLDQMGPESAKSFPGQQLDYGRRGKGYIFGAFQPATGEAFTAPYGGRTIANWVDFLGRVEAWIPPEVERVHAIGDNLNVHRATDVLLFSLAHPRWEFVFQPTYAAYLNLIEPWWKVLRSLALKGRRFETWDAVCQAVRDATAYWNAHKHPFVWGRRRRHRPRRPGVGLPPTCPTAGLLPKAA